MYPCFKKNNFIKLKPTKPFVSFVTNNTRHNFEVNSSAAEIFSLCNGVNTIDEIVRILCEKYNEKYDVAKKYVEDLINPFIDNGIIYFAKEKTKQIVCRGSSEVYLPDSVVWEITEKCPLKCKHCYLGKKKYDDITESNYKDIISQLKQCGVATVLLTGGDPLVHQNLTKIIPLLIEEGFTVSLATSGTVFDDNILSYLELLKTVNGSVQVSIDGSEDYHNRLRGNKNAYRKSMEFIELLSEKGITCTVATCLIDQDETVIFDLAKIIKEKGATLYTISLLFHEGDAALNNIESQYTHTRVKALIQKLNEEYSTDNFRVREYVEDVNASNCGAGYNLIRIKANLEITPCPMNNIQMGNLNDFSIKEIAGQYANSFSKICSPNKYLCENCPGQEQCGSCSANAILNKDCYSSCQWYEIQKDVINNTFSKEGAV